MHHAITLILICLQATNLFRNIDILDLNPRTRTRFTALQLRRRSIRSRIDGPLYIFKGDVADIKQTRIATWVRAIIRCTLRDDEGDARIMDLEILKSDIGCITQSSSTTIRRIACLDTSPGLDVTDVEVIVEAHIARGDVLNDLVDAVVLADATNSNATTFPARYVFHKDVGGVGLLRDAVVAIGDIPVSERDIVRVDGVGAVRVVRGGAVVGGAANVDVLEQDVLGVDHSHGPHLALHEAHIFDHGVVDPGECDLMWSARIVGLAMVEVIPDLPIAVKSAIAVTVEMDIVASKSPGRRLVLIAHRKRAI